VPAGVSAKAASIGTAQDLRPRALDESDRSGSPGRSGLDPVEGRGEKRLNRWWFRGIRPSCATSSMLSKPTVLHLSLRSITARVAPGSRLAWKPGRKSVDAGYAGPNPLTRSTGSKKHSRVGVVRSCMSIHSDVNPPEPVGGGDRVVEAPPTPPGQKEPS
jgi:hypothetical protein